MAWDRNEISAGQVTRPESRVLNSAQQNAGSTSEPGCHRSVYISLFWKGCPTASVAWIQSGVSWRLLAVTKMGNDWGLPVVCGSKSGEYNRAAGHPRLTHTNSWQQLCKKKREKDKSVVPVTALRPLLKDREEGNRTDSRWAAQPPRASHNTVSLVFRRCICHKTQSRNTSQLLQLVLSWRRVGDLS